MSRGILRIEIVSPTLVEVTTPASELGLLPQFLSEHGLLSMRQSDCVVIKGSWRKVLSVLSEYTSDPWLGDFEQDSAEMVAEVAG